MSSWRHKIPGQRPKYFLDVAKPRYAHHKPEFFTGRWVCARFPEGWDVAQIAADDGVSEFIPTTDGRQVEVTFEAFSYWRRYNTANDARADMKKYARTPKTALKGILTSIGRIKKQNHARMEQKLLDAVNIRMGIPFNDLQIEPTVIIHEPADHTHVWRLSTGECVFCDQTRTT